MRIARVAEDGRGGRKGGWRQKKGEKKGQMVKLGGELRANGGKLRANGKNWGEFEGRI